MSLLQITDPVIGNTLNGYLDTLNVKSLSVNGKPVSGEIPSLQSVLAKGNTAGVHNIVADSSYIRTAELQTEQITLNMGSLQQDIKVNNTLKLETGKLDFKSGPSIGSIGYNGATFTFNPALPTETVETVSGTADLSPTSSVSYVSGPSHNLPKSNVVGFQKTIINNGPSVFSSSVLGNASGPIYKLVQATSGLGAGLIFACGDVALFQTIGTATGLNGIAVYNPTGSTIAGVPANTWQGLKTGLQRSGVANSGIAYTMVFDLNGDLYVGGTFESADNVVVTKCIAKWTVGTAGASATWVSITPSGFNGSNIRSIVSDPAGNLYMGGLFVSINGVAATNVVKYVPSTGTFSALNAGVSGGTQPVAGLFFDTQTGFLFAGGTLTSAGAPTTGVGYWNPSTGLWSPMGVGLVGQVNGFYRYSPTALYAYGAITNLGPNTNVGTPALRLALWNGSSWSGLGSGTSGMIFDAFSENNVIYFMSSTGVHFLDVASGYLGPYVAGTLSFGSSIYTVLKIPGTKSYYLGGDFPFIGVRYNAMNNIALMNVDNEVYVKPIEYIQPSKSLMSFVGDSIVVRWNGSKWMREAVAGSVILVGPI